METDDSAEMDLVSSETTAKRTPSREAPKSLMKEIVLEYLAEHGHYHPFQILMGKQVIAQKPVTLQPAEKQVISESTDLANAVNPSGEDKEGTEAATAPSPDKPLLSRIPPLIKERGEIRELLEKGYFEDCIQKIDEFFPLLFSDYPFLLFLVLQQEVLESAYIDGISRDESISQIIELVSPLLEDDSSLVKHAEDLVCDVIFRKKTRATVLQNRRQVFEQINQQILMIQDYEMKNTLRKVIEEVKVLMANPAVFSAAKECKALWDFLANTTTCQVSDISNGTDQKTTSIDQKEKDS